VFCVAEGITPTTSSIESKSGMDTIIRRGPYGKSASGHNGSPCTHSLAAVSGMGIDSRQSSNHYTTLLGTLAKEFGKSDQDILEIISGAITNEIDQMTLTQREVMEAVANKFRPKSPGHHSSTRQCIAQRTRQSRCTGVLIKLLLRPRSSWTLVKPCFRT
jgi:hypothetical protein